MLKKEDTQSVSSRCVVMHNPLPAHSHPNAEQIYYVRAGRGLININGEEQVVEKDTIIYIPPNATHSATPLEGDEPFSYVFFNRYF